MESKDVVSVLRGSKIEGITIQEINKKHCFDEVISIAQSNYDFLTKQSKNKSISRFNAMRCERNYWKGVKELAEQRKEACLALERIKEQDLLLKIVFQYLTNDFEVNWEEYKEYNKYPKSLLDIRVMIDLLDLKYLNNARFRKRLGVEKFSKEVESFFRNDLKEVHTILNEKKEVLQNGK